MKYFTRILIFVVFPISIIWALNTLFGLNIAYNWSTWLAMLILMLVAMVFLFPIYKARKDPDGHSDSTSL